MIAWLGSDEMGAQRLRGGGKSPVCHYLGPSSSYTCVSRHSLLAAGSYAVSV